MATIYYSIGKQKKVSPKNGKHFTTKELQFICGGYVEFVYLRDDDQIMVVNQEAQIDQAPFNHRATEIYIKNFPENPLVVLGNILVTPSKYLK